MLSDSWYIELTLQLAIQALLHWRTWYLGCWVCCQQAAAALSPFRGCLCSRELCSRIQALPNVMHPKTEHAGMKRPDHLSPIQDNAKRSFWVTQAGMGLSPSSSSPSAFLIPLLPSPGTDSQGASSYMVRGCLWGNPSHNNGERRRGWACGFRQDRSKNSDSGDSTTAQDEQEWDHKTTTHFTVSCAP